MAAFNKFNSFVEALAEKVHNLGSDSLMIDITQIANGNGYTTGGAAVTVTGSSQTGGSYTLTQSADVVWTASGAMGPFRYAVLYNTTATNDELIGWWDYGTTVSLAPGETFTVDFNATTGILTIT
jgi:hypothetical protein